MSVCPFCKAQVAQSTAPCPRCGKLAADHPSIAAISGRTLSTDFEDDDAGGLEMESTGLGSGGVGGGGHGMSFESSKGVTLDDDLFGDDEHSGPLELDDPRPPSVPDLAPPPPAAPISSKMPADVRAPAANTPPAPPSSQKMPVAPPAAPNAAESGPHPVASAGAAPEPPPPPSLHDQAAVRIANYPPPPAKIWQAPRYALQVLYRQFELRQDLESLRRKRSPDVGLYERALRTHDARMYKTGLAITGVAVFLALLLFFMPVIKRFAFAPD